MNVQVTSDDINILIYKYLHESGFNFSPAVFNMEAKVEEAAHRKGIAEKDVETGLLVKIIYKGLFYMDMELHALPDESTIKCSAPIHLIHKHRCITNVSSLTTTVQNTTNEINDGNETIQINENNDNNLNQNNNDKKRKYESSTEEEEIKHLDEEQRSNKEREQKKEKDRARGKDRKKDERVRDRKRIKDKDREAEFELTRNNVNSQPSPSTSNNIIELKGHSKDPTEANTIAIAYADGFSCIYNSKGALRSNSQVNSVLTIKWSPKGEHLLTVTQDGFSICTDKRGNTVGQYKHETVYDVAWASDDSFAASTKNNILFYTIKQENPIKTLTGHEGPVKCLAYDISKTYLASGSSDYTVKIWKENKKVIHSLNHESAVHALTWSQAMKSTNKKKETGYILATIINNLFLLSATQDHKVTIWDAENGKKLKEFNDNQAIISSLEFSPNGALLALGSYDQNLLIIDSKSYEPKISYKSESPIYHLHWDALGTKIAFTLANGNVIVMDMK
ncbi:WD40 repeat-like protein [Rhizophagus irregularis]|uniref:WD40 repeat-like protein n=1 Tax=Rhizophagus irregularis TaxID=588596 RepID=A0A2N1NSY8_9GLOM|nr:WD40 repeat-like protein [Rhizophagus irregularis]